jgi:ABC-type multidrug transport system fused ATPase/permease subunit
MRGLSIEDVVAGYGQGDILRGVNLEVLPGTITCVIGPNGAGKSTVLKVISALLQPTRGVIRVDGEVISGRTPRAVLDRGVVHVPQERSLFPLMTVWDNVLMGGYTLSGRDALRTKIEEIAERFPVYALLPEPPKGFRQRLQVQRLNLSRRLRLAHRLVVAGLLLVALTIVAVRSFRAAHRWPKSALQTKRGRTYHRDSNDQPTDRSCARLGVWDGDSIRSRISRKSHCKYRCHYLETGSCCHHATS